MTEEQSEQATPLSWPHHAAKASWAAFVVVIVMLMFSGSVQAAKAILDLVAIILAVVGVLSGIVALFGISKYGIKKILWPALVGIILNGFLVFIWVMNFMRAFNAARQAG